MPEKKIKLLGWVAMLLFPLIIGSSYFIFFSDSLKILSGDTPTKQTENKIQRKEKTKEGKSVIKGVLATKAKAPEKTEKNGELWSEKEKNHTKVEKKKETSKTQKAVIVNEGVSLEKHKITKAVTSKLSKIRQRKQTKKKKNYKRKKFSVRIGIFRIAKNAGILVNKARKKGYQAFVTIKETQVREKRIYIGNFTKISDVRKARKTFSEHGIESHPQTSKGQTYSVYLGPFPLKQNTKKVELLSKKNAYKTLVKIEKIKRNFNYVWIGTFDVKEKATRFALKLRKKFPGCIAGVI